MKLKNANRKWMSVLMIFSLLLSLISSLVGLENVFAAPVADTTGNALADKYDNYGGIHQVAYPAWRINDGTDQSRVANFVGGTQVIGGAFSQNPSVSSNPSDNYIKFTDSEFTETNPKYQIRKYATATNVPGQYNVKLNIKGNSDVTKTPMDIVFVVDDSSSMGEKIDGDVTRRDVIKAGIKSFIDSLNGTDYDLRIGLQTYAGFEKMVGYNKYGQIVKYFYPKDNSVPISEKVALTNIKDLNSNDILNKIFNRDGQATFTQYGLSEGANKFTDSTRKKVMIHLTDGVPTVSKHIDSISAGNHIYALTDFSWITEDQPNYNVTKTKDKQTYIAKRRYDYPSSSSLFSQANTLADLDGGENYTGRSYKASWTDINSTWPATLKEAENVRKSGISIHTLGISLKNDGKLLSVEGIKNYMNELSGVGTSVVGTPGLFETADNAAEIKTFLDKELSGVIQEYCTVQRGIVTDPIGDQYYLTSIPTLTDVSESGSKIAAMIMDNMKATLQPKSLVNNHRTISLGQIHLHKGQEIEINYTVQLNTEDPNFIPEAWYPINGRTTFTPNETDPTVDFGVPSGKGEGTQITLNKVWQNPDGSTYEPPAGTTVAFTIGRKNVSAANQTNTWSEQKLATTTLSKNAQTGWQTTLNSLSTDASGNYFLGNNTGKLLPRYNNSGTEFSYYIAEELLTEEMQDKFTFTHSGESTSSLTATNKLLKDGFYKFRAEKFDQDNQSKGLEGAIFGIYKNEECTDELTKVTTGENGVSDEIHLESGKYWIKEIEAPTGYLLDSTVMPVEILSDGTFTWGDDFSTVTGTDIPTTNGFYHLQADAASTENNTLVYRMYDKKVHELPETGSQTLLLLIAISVSLLLSGVILLVIVAKIARKEQVK